MNSNAIKQSKELMTSTLVYMVLQFLQPFLGLVLLQPIFLHYFSADEYGILSMMTAYTVLVGPLATLGIGSGFYRFYYDYHKSTTALYRFLGQLTSVALILLGFSALVLFNFGDSFFRFLFKDEAIRFWPYGFWATLTGFGNAIYILFVVLLRNQKRLKLFSALVGIQVLLSVSLQLFLVMSMGYGLEGALMGRGIALVATVVVVLIIFFKYLTFKIDFDKIREPILFARSELPNSVLNWGFSIGDRFLLERLLNTTLVGIYGLLNTLVGMIEMGYFMLRAAVLPYVYEAFELEKDAAENQFERVYRFYTICLLLGITAVIFAVCCLHLITDKPDYLQVRQYVFIYSIGYLCGGVNFLLYLQFFYQKKPEIVLFFNSIGISSIILFNVLLTPIIGLWGAVTASVFTKCTLCLLLYIQYPKLFSPLSKIPGIKSFLLLFLSILSISMYLTAANHISYPTAGLAQFCLLAGVLLWMNKDLIQVLRK